MAAPKNNSNARQGEKSKTGIIHIRVDMDEKNLWTNTAQASPHRKLAAWIRRTLNEAAKSAADKQGPATHTQPDPRPLKRD